MVRKIRSEEDFQKLILEFAESRFLYPEARLYCTENVDEWLEKRLEELQELMRDEINKEVEKSINQKEMARLIADAVHPYMMDLYNINEIVEAYLEGKRNFSVPGGVVTSSKSVVDAIHRITRKHF